MLLKKKRRSLQHFKHNYRSINNRTYLGLLKRLQVCYYCKYNSSSLYLPYITDVVSYLPKLAVVLQPVQEDWELLGHQLNIDQSILTGIRNKGDSTKQMKYLLEEWSIKGGTLTQLEDALLHIDKKYVISGMLYYNVNIVICQCVKHDIIIIVILLSDLLPLQDKESTYTDISVQISTDKLNQDSTGNLYII